MALAQAEGAEKIVRQSGLQMLNLVSNLLDVQKHEQSAMKLSLENTPLTRIVHRAFSEVAYLAKQKNIQMSLRLQADFVLHVDPEIVKRVFVNIFTNAIRFSDSGGQVRILAEATAASRVKVTVSDEGEGIAPDYLPFVFDKFSQGTPRSAGYQASTGIGLTFCKMAVEAHGGEIGVVAGQDKGASFWFTLPLSSISKKTPAMQHELMLRTETPAKLVLATQEKAYLMPFCEKLGTINVHDLMAAREILRAIEGRTENLLIWKTLIMEALEACNDQGYRQLLRLCDDDPVTDTDP